MRSSTVVKAKSVFVRINITSIDSDDEAVLVFNGTLDLHKAFLAEVNAHIRYLTRAPLMSKAMLALAISPTAIVIDMLVMAQRPIK